jgi:hypothetical protein
VELDYKIVATTTKDYQDDDGNYYRLLHEVKSLIRVGWTARKHINTRNILEFHGKLDDAKIDETLPHLRALFNNNHFANVNLEIGDDTYNLRKQTRRSKGK